MKTAHPAVIAKLARKAAWVAATTFAAVVLASNALAAAGAPVPAAVLDTEGGDAAAEHASRTLVALGDGVYVLVGALEEPAPGNRGAIGNIGLLAGDSGTIVIGTGISYRDGRALIDAAARITGQQVVLAVVTQPLQEFVMGMEAFAERGIPVVAHQDAAELIAERCEVCLHNLRRLLGEDEMAGTRVRTPSRSVTESTTLEAGGRRIELVHPGWASAPGDLLVRDLATGVVFTGALAAFDRVPEMRDGHIQTWLATLDTLAAQAPAQIAPGYGLPASAERLREIRRYIADTDALAKARVDTGAALSEVAVGADLPGFAGWALYPTLHPRNLHYRYLARERALLEGHPDD